ncbi:MULTISPECIES: LysR family transcriptional regulator [Bifidobacterium]|jgi:DNA-binding transcriptional LysR family regulator|uniref:LysR family transcriptional regulator n=1 Tax=Bifidobacterium tibiigranuli TaxID=2172043 RepID=A0A5N6RX50_9BIFI|nr:LysR family transcriptional regulator [Bifidobacterium tibiigranuli]KAE8127006.1 LysR family transcriptional regulator [Bifidobacterium tibiigranuli]KAE8127796.1 LysR family transcriptional regulator [Bifidobacterium tibiigranuli]MCH3973929.1 LysR family transcriptional regulator [Bifidobacterium tibiigranuli]MCH4190342.1 LysR family transcriptional regulator [Bifidobacterium tibiigranuli]MCH4203923.1 LysR family transcriptional regulator [Bifidobacterium tibiigranuli]
MDLSLREIRFFVAAAETGSFTDAAPQLHVSQAAVSRTIANLEKAAGSKLLRRLPRGCELTGVGQQILPHARRVLAEAERLREVLASQHSTLRLGYAWSALGSHTVPLQREWAKKHQDIALELIRYNSPTSGLAEGLCDAAIVRIPVNDKRFDSVVVGLERRLVAFASDDLLWSQRERVTMGEIAERTVIIDPRTGTTNIQLWSGLEYTPKVIESNDVDSWLDAIAAGQGVGTTAEATAHHHPRPGISYRPITDGPRIPVRLVWWHDEQPAGLNDLIGTVTQLYASD